MMTQRKDWWRWALVVAMCVAALGYFGLIAPALFRDCRGQGLSGWVCLRMVVR